MSSFTENHPFIYSFYCIICVLPFVISLPIPNNDPYDIFIEFLSNNNCSMPKEVELPFSVTNSAPFNYLSYPLKECKSSDAVNENNEANLLCREVFEVIQNITCIDYKLNNSKIDSGNLSSDVCQDFAAIQDVIPKQKEFLSTKLGDSIICRIMCTGKYEFLCKTLLWGYDTQAKLKNATLEKNAAQTEENLESHPDNNEIPLEETVPKSEKPTKALNSDIEVTNKKNVNLEKPQKVFNKSSSTPTAASDIEPKSHTIDEAKRTESKLSDSEGMTKESGIHEGMTKESGIHEDKFKTPKTNAENIDKSGEASKVITNQPKSEAVSKSSIDSSEQNQNITGDKNNDLGENNIEMPTKSSSKNDKVDVPTIDVNISASDAEGNEEPDVAVPIQDEDNKVDASDSKEKTKTLPNPTGPKTEEKNHLNKSDLVNVKQDEAKETQADLDSKGEEPKENEIPNGESDSNASEPTVQPIFPDKSDDFEQQPELKDPEQYNDSENDGDYPKPEYDTAFNPALKKESNVKTTLNEGSNQFSSGSNMQISNENFLGHESDINRNFLPARNYLPDQEDSHFFFYFLTIVLVLMAGYLIFHNKQKIIALIVEGRHERRRRSHGAGYKKLETK